MGSSISVPSGQSYDDVELTTLQSYGLIPAYAEFVQGVRKWFGIANITSGTWFAVYGISALLVFGIGLILVITIIFNVLNQSKFPF